MKPLPVLLLSDERPGHVNLAEGCLSAARRIRPLAVTRLIARRGGWPGTALAAWSNARMSDKVLLSRVYAVDYRDLPQAELVVSAGAETLAANVASARLLKARNIFYGSLRYFRPENFTLALTSYAADCRHPSQVFVLKPSPAAIAAFAARRQADHRGNHLGLLVGGPSGETTFADADWRHLLALIKAVPNQIGRWLVANSRRTPAPISDCLAALAATPMSPIAEFIDVRQASSPSLQSILERAAALFVTDDSSSMVSEAIAAGAPTVGLYPLRHHLISRERRYRMELQQRGWYRPLPLSAPAADIIASADTLVPRREDIGAEIAQLLAARMPELFSS